MITSEWYRIARNGYYGQHADHDPAEAAEVLAMLVPLAEEVVSGKAGARNERGVYARASASERGVA